MQKILKWLTPAIAVGVAVFLVFFLYSINSVPLQEVQDVANKVQIETLKPQKTWLEHFYTSKKEGYQYPVNELYLKVDLDEQITKAKTYRLVASIKDPYEQFCLEAELKRHKLKYFLKKDIKGIDLLIYSQKVDKLTNLTKVLKKYKIDARVELQQ